MFDLFAMLLSSIASFLFPIFASYKALKTSDPAQLTPWLMYWVVFSCCMLVESWVSFILMWIPFYGYIRLLFLLYLILPQTQGARIIYEEHIHPFLEENEGHIDEFIASAHDRLKSAGIAYFKQAIEFIKTNLLGLPPSETPPPTPDPTGSQTYTQALLARFSVPAARWTGSTNAGADFYNLLASAVSAATAAAGKSGASGVAGDSSLIPDNLQSSGEKMTFIAAQRERLNILLSALDNEAQQLQRNEAQRAQQRGQQAARSTSINMDGTDDDNDDGETTQRPPSGLSMWSALSKSRSEADFEKIEAESGTEDDGSVRRRKVQSRGSTGGWMPWNWGGENDTGDAPSGTASGADQ